LSLDGSIQRRLGRKGAGPGEYGRGTSGPVCVTRDSQVFVYDMQLNRITRFASDGRYLDSANISVGRLRHLTSAEGVFLFGRVFQIRERDILGTLTAISYNDMRVIAGGETYVMQRLQARDASGGQAPNLEWSGQDVAYSGVLKCWLIWSPENCRLERVDLTSLKRTGDILVLRSKQNGPAANGGCCDVPPPDNLQENLYDSFAVDQEGFIWLERPRESAGGPRIADVFDPYGVFVVQTKLPTRLWRLKFLPHDVEAGIPDGKIDVIGTGVHDGYEVVGRWRIKRPQ
jgi:hypothetical protein